MLFQSHHLKIPPKKEKGIRYMPQTERLRTEKFSKMFSIFISAIRHEFSNSLGTIQCFLFRNHPDNYDKFERIYRSLERIKLLESFVNPDKGLWFAEIQKFFSDSEISSLGVHSSCGPDPKVYWADGEKVRKFVSSETTELMAGLYALREFLYQTGNKDKKISGVLDLGFEIATLLFDLSMDSPFDCRLRPVTIFSADSSGSLSFDGTLKLVLLPDIEISLNPEGMEKERLDVLSHPVFFRLILHNILTNARESAEIKKVKPCVEIDVSEDSQYAVLEFKDNGNGMPEDVMGALNSGKRITTKNVPGFHGAGFHYCRQLAGTMGGSLYVRESKPGEGTTVVLELKLA
ncbi:ATP-binding protein [Candidatus Micrarchaeota archaeon]|nr:ATP-binding protein [Candidatus Micrarchaeota archaeon]